MIDRESSEFGRGIASIWVHRLHRVAERIWKKSTAWRIVRTRFSGSWAYGFRFAGWIWSGIALWCGFYRQRSRKSENLALLYVECQKIGGKVMDFLDFQTKSSEISFFSVFLRVKAGFFDRRARCRRFHSISAPGIGFCPRCSPKIQPINHEILAIVDSTGFGTSHLIRYSIILNASEVSIPREVSPGGVLLWLLRVHKV